MDLDEKDLDLGSNLDVPVKPKKAAQGKEPTAAPKPDRVRIILEENDNIPPTGQYIGYNGRGYLLRPGEEVDVPIAIKEILDNAIETVPQIDPTTRRVVGYRERTRYPYRLVS